jgi:hypothetical protein
MTKGERKNTIEFLIAMCEARGIEIPLAPRIRELEAALNEYNKDAVVVDLGDRFALRKTDKPTAEYTVAGTVFTRYTFRAESIEAAIGFMESGAFIDYIDEFGDFGGVEDFELLSMNKEED